MSIVLWFTGLSGSGKTTIAHALEKELVKLGKSVAVLDGDVVRATFHKHLTFARDDIRENNKLTAELAKKKMAEADVVIVPIISPYTEDRAMVRKIVGKGFVEVFIDAPLEAVVKRDVKGLYKKALAGEIKDFIGVAKTHPYEKPEHPDVGIDTTKLSVEESVDLLLDFLKKL
jgi:adenylyl-sulfate kinase